SSRPRRQRLRRRRLSNALSPASQVSPTGPRIRTATSRSSRIRNTTTRAISAAIASPASHEGEEAYPNNAVTLPLPTTPEEELEAAIEAPVRRRPKTIASGRISRRDSVVPFGMKGIAGYVEGRHFLVGDFDAFWIGVGIEFAADRQAGLGWGVRDQFARDDNVCERRSTPVLGDVAEHTVVDLVPLRSAGRIMADV